MWKLLWQLLFILGMISFVVMFFIFVIGGYKEIIKIIKNKNTKTILGWCFYDFANSPFTTIVVTFIYSAYFASGIMSNEAMGQVYWGNTVTICAIIIAFLSPIMGAAADQGGYRK